MKLLVPQVHLKCCLRLKNFKETVPFSPNARDLPDNFEHTVVILALCKDSGT